MTDEPDEALIWAREQIIRMVKPEMWDAFRNGNEDNNFWGIKTRADAYRAGQAASAERIKALEELLNHAEDLFDWAVQSDCENGVRWLNEAAATKYLADAPATKAAILEIRELARALLKEADQ